MALAIYNSHPLNLSYSIIILILSLQGTIGYDKIVLKYFEQGVVMEFLCTFHGWLNFQFPRICAMKWA